MATDTKQKKKKKKLQTKKKRPEWHKSAHKLARAGTDGLRGLLSLRNWVRYILFSSPPSYFSCNTTSGVFCLSRTLIGWGFPSEPDWSAQIQGACDKATPKRVRNVLTRIWNKGMIFTLSLGVLMYYFDCKILYDVFAFVFFKKYFE